MAEEQLSLARWNLSRQTALEKVRLPMEEQIQLIVDHVMPLRGDILGREQPGSARKGSKIYDGTAVGAHELFTNGLYGNIMGPNQDWLGVTLTAGRFQGLLEVPEVRQYFQDFIECITSAMNRSNFYQEAWNWIWEWSGAGTGILYIEEDLSSGKICFENIPWGQTWVAENRYGHIDVIHRKWKLSARQAVQKFSKEKLSKPIQNAFDKDPFATFEFLHAVYPRADRNPSKLDAKNKPYASVWMEFANEKERAAASKKDVLLESGYDMFPLPTCRYLKDGAIPYGWSPASLCLADIIGVDAMAKTMLEAAQRSVAPPLNVPANMKGRVRLQPLGLNYYDDPQAIIKPIGLGTGYAIGIEAMERKQKYIEERYHVPYFLMLARSEAVPKTAEEVRALRNEQIAILGPLAWRLYASLDNVLDIVVSIEEKAGRMPEVPQVLIDFAGGERIDYQYLGPLQQAQQVLYKQKGLRAFVDEVLTMANLIPSIPKIGEAISDNFDWDDFMRKLALSVDIPASTVHRMEQVQKVRQGKMQALMQEQQGEDATQLTQGIETLAKADKAMGGKLGNALKGTMPMMGA